MAFAVTAAVACSSKSTADTDNVKIDTVSEGNTEIIIDSVNSTTTDVVAEKTDDVVVVFNNDSKAEPQGKPLVIDFSATWCGPCQGFKPVYHKVAAEMADKATFATADVDECTDLAQKYDIQSIPFVLILNPDGSKASHMGRMTEPEFRTFLKKNLK